MDTCIHSLTYQAGAGQSGGQAPGPQRRGKGGPVVGRRERLLPDRGTCACVCMTCVYVSKAVSRVPRLV